MAKQIYREKSLNYISSPEQLNDYLKVTKPAVWAILAAEQYMEENGYEDVKIKNANEAIMDILEETGFTDLVEII